MDEDRDREAGATEPEGGDVAMRRRLALQRLGKIAVYTTPLVIGLLSSDAWSECG